MPEPLEIPAPKRQLPVLWIAIGTLVAMLGLFYFQLFGPNPPILISKQTTFITEPLGEDGLPDYCEFVRQKLFEDVTFENNAAALLATFVNKNELSSRHFASFFDQLNIDAVARESHHFRSLDKEIAARSGATTHQMWSRNYAPRLVEWIEEQQLTLDLAVKASSRSQYSTPLVGEQPDAEAQPTLVSVLLPIQQKTVEIVSALCMRAMNRLQENEMDSAKSDLFAAARLNRLLTKRGFLICHQIACENEYQVMKALRTMFDAGRLDSKNLRLATRELEDLGKLSRVSNSLNPYSRVMLLDIVLNCQRYGIGSIAAGGFSEWNGVDDLRLDYNYAFRDINLWYDRLDNIAVMTNRPLRNSAWDKFNSDLQDISRRASAEKDTKLALFSHRRRSQTVSDIFIALLLPNVELALQHQDRSDTQLELTKLAAALAIYRAEQGEYPETLELLVPVVIPKLPLDLYSGKSFIYQRKDDGGYLLYSVYENEIDDGGTDYSGEIIDGEYVDEQPADFYAEESDLVVRVPVPPFQFPELPPTVEELPKN